MSRVDTTSREVAARDVLVGDVVTIDGTRATVTGSRRTDRGTVILTTTQADFWLMPSQPVRVHDLPRAGW